MRQAILIALLLVVADNATAYDPDNYGYVMIGAGNNSGGDWDDGGSMGNSFTVGFTRRMGNSQWYWGGRFDHYSQLLVSQPFNDKHESTLNHWGLTLEYRW